MAMKEALLYRISLPLISRSLVMNHKHCTSSKSSRHGSNDLQVCSSLRFFVEFSNNHICKVQVLVGKSGQFHNGNSVARSVTVSGQPAMDLLFSSARNLVLN